jgi:hypothetical protein
MREEELAKFVNLGFMAFFDGTSNPHKREERLSQLVKLWLEIYSGSQQLGGELLKLLTFQVSQIS